MKSFPLAACCSVMILGQQVNGSEYPQATIREEQNVTVDGANETWQLRWAAAPTPYCEPSFLSRTCPCGGFAYGEAGDLSVVRVREGVDIDQLRLSPFFATTDREAVLQRWALDYDRDLKSNDFKTLARQVRRRPTVQVMYFADYDHDGEASEFYLQTEVAPCLKSVGVVIGISKTNPCLSSALLRSPETTHSAGARVGGAAARLRPGES